jgi:outer membrane protein assembly factor BamB
MPDKYALIARDAFNGVQLWKMPINDWGWEAWVQSMYASFLMGRHFHPTQIQRRLVAHEDCVYVTLGFNAPVTELDAATGKVLRVFSGTEYTSEILYYRGKLILAVNNGPQRAGFVRDNPPVKKKIMALDVDTGEPLWQAGDFVGISTRSSPLQRITQLTMAVGKEGVFLVEEDALVGLDLDDGTELWRAPRPARPAEKTVDMYRNDHTNLCTLVYHKGNVLFGQPRVQARKPPWNNTQPSDLLVLDAGTGQAVWAKEIGSWEYGTPIGIYVTGGLIWVHGSQGYQLLGLDPQDGQVKRTLPTEAMFNAGHHHRCTRNKATSRYLITSRRGVELIDFESGEMNVNTWIRGECGYGMLPCNGLLYVTPHPCKCFIEEKLSGLFALAPRRRASSQPDSVPPRFTLEAGPAYDEFGDRNSASEIDDVSRARTGPPPPPLSTAHSADWPTYRGDPARSGATAEAVSAHLRQRWQADIGRSPTAPVIADSKVFIGAADEHRVMALDATSGKRLWSFTANGRVDTPPTFYRGTVLFGCGDGAVYCLCASDGQLVWRLRVAPDEQHVVAYGHVASAWSVHGSVLVVDDVAYVAAGRSSHLDGGICIHAIEPVAGEILRTQTLAASERQSQKSGGSRGTLTDILVYDGNDVHMRQFRVAPLEGQERKLAVHGGKLRILATGGFLDDTWFNRVFWSVDGRPLGQMLVANASSVYGIRAYQRPGDVNAHFAPGQEGYQLFAFDRNRPAGKDPTRAKDRKRGRSPLVDRWAVRIPVRAQSLVLAGDVLFAAGTPDEIDPEDPWAAIEGRRGGRLWAISAEDGGKLAEYRLAAAPVYDGMAAARGRLYAAGRDGTLQCFAE